MNQNFLSQISKNKHKYTMLEMRMRTKLKALKFSEDDIDGHVKCFIGKYEGKPYSGDVNKEMLKVVKSLKISMKKKQSERD